MSEKPDKIRTAADIYKKIDGWLKPKNVTSLYKKACINYTGRTTDTGAKYTEVIAECVLNNLQALDGIQKITRTRSSYKVEHAYTDSKQATSKGSKVQTEEQPEKKTRTKLIEEQIARSMMGETFNYIGQIIDYQTPLKNEQDDAAGKIDLLSWNESENRVYMLEFKVNDSTETLLRCVLEIETYSRIVDHEKLLRDFGHEGAALRKAAFVYKNSRPHTDFKEDVKVKELMKALGVDLFVLNESGKKIEEAHYYEDLEV